MSRNIIINDNIDYIIKEHFISKRSIADISSELHIDPNVIRRNIIKSNRVPFNFKLWSDGVFVLKCAIALYNYGIGLRGIADRLDIPIAKMTSEFKRQGIKLRTQSEQEVKKWSIMDKEKRLKQVEACHNSTKGVPQKHSALVKMAQSRCKRRSLYEEVFESALIDSGISFEAQFPIDKYNIDFVIGNVAVEIFGGKWHSHGSHILRFPERTKKIFDSGYALVVLYITEPKFFSREICSDFIKFIYKLSIDKSSIGKYWVVWRTLNTVTHGCSDSIDVALVSPFANIRNRVSGRYESVAI